MSFGGAIAGELCMYDTRCAVGVNMDGGNFPFSSTNAEEPAPFLMFHSDSANLYSMMEMPLPATGPRSSPENSRNCPTMSRKTGCSSSTFPCPWPRARASCKCWTA